MTELQGLTILVVEDDEDTREVLKMMLEMCGARVLCAETARVGLKTFREEHPQAIVSDIAMPGETGYWLVQEIRKLPASYGGKLPALAVTAFGAVFSRERALEAGFNDYLPKPLDPWELCRCVARLAGRAP